MSILIMFHLFSLLFLSLEFFHFYLLLFSAKESRSDMVVPFLNILQSFNLLDLPPYPPPEALARSWAFCELSDEQLGSHRCPLLIKALAFLGLLSHYFASLLSSSWNCMLSSFWYLAHFSQFYEKTKLNFISIHLISLFFLSLFSPLTFHIIPSPFYFPFSSLHLASPQNDKSVPGEHPAQPPHFTDGK